MAKSHPSILFSAHKEFFPGTQEFPAYLTHSDVKQPRHFENYDCDVSAWPAIVEKEKVKHLANVAQAIPRLIQSIPNIYFSGNAKSIADFYFNGNEIYGNVALAFHNKKQPVSCRLDTAIADDQFNPKVLEANIGPNLGGWEINAYEPKIRQLHAPLREKHTKGLYHTHHILINYLNYIVEGVQTNLDIKDSCNVFVSMGTESKRQIKLVKSKFLYVKETYDSLLPKLDLEGSIFLGDLTELEDCKGQVVHRGCDIHCIISLDFEQTNLPKQVVRSALIDKVYFPNHLSSPMYADKRNLSILRELAKNNILSSEDCRVVLKCVPWTQPMTNMQVEYNQSTYLLPDLLKERKDKFVLKPAQGFSGNEVFIGKNTSQMEWNQKVLSALLSKKFVAQEYCESMEVLAPNAYNEWTPHNVVWGLFCFGEKYGGMWLRRRESAGGNGVINANTGAIETIAYEVVS